MSAYVAGNVSGLIYIAREKPSVLSKVCTLVQPIIRRRARRFDPPFALMNYWLKLLQKTASLILINTPYRILIAWQVDENSAI